MLNSFLESIEFAEYQLVLTGLLVGAIYTWWKVIQEGGGE
jgi:hypothetical protein